MTRRLFYVLLMVRSLKPIIWRCEVSLMPQFFAFTMQTILLAFLCFGSLIWISDNHFYPTISIPTTTRKSVIYQSISYLVLLFWCIMDDIYFWVVVAPKNVEPYLHPDIGFPLFSMIFSTSFILFAGGLLLCSIFSLYKKGK